MRTRSALLAALGLTAVAVASAVVPTAAGAIDQDLVVSAAAGPPGTEITVSSASCTSTDDLDAFLEVVLIVGTAPDEQLAGFGSDFDGSALVTVPDWVDPDAPAVLEATCSTYDLVTDEDQYLDYDPVAFDIEPGTGAPVQVRTFSRTELLAGQGFTVTGTCGSGFADAFATAAVIEGTDQTGRGLNPAAAQGYALTDDQGAFEVPVIVSNATVYIASDEAQTTIESLGVAEEPMQLEPGDYTVLTFCQDLRSPSALVLEPSPFTVTGSAPTGAVDLVSADAVEPEVELAGECDQEVTGWLDGLSLADLIAEFEGSGDARTAPASRRPLLTDGRSVGRTADQDLAIRAGERPDAAGGRLVASQEPSEFSATPAADGTWSHTDEVAFDQGVVIGQAACGDPFADGYAYDPQGVVVDAAEAPTTTVPQLVPPTVPAPPAGAIPGTPTYAG